jgi:hypothetical protein
MIREEYLDITGNDHCGAALLHIFEYLTSQKVESLEDPSIEPWVSITKKKLSEYIFGLFSERKIYESLLMLEQQGWIKTIAPKQVGDKCLYLLDADGISSAILPTEELHARKIADASTAKLPTNVGKIADAYKEVDISVDIQTKDIYPTPLLLENQTPTQPEHLRATAEETPNSAALCDSKYFAEEIGFSDEELQIDEDLARFLANVYRQSRGAKLDKLTTRASEALLRELEEKEQHVGAQTFRSAVKLFLADDAQWLKDNKWPIRSFLKQASRWIEKAEDLAPGRTQDEAPMVKPTHGTTQPPAAPSEGRLNADGNSSSALLQSVDRWNIFNPDGPCRKLLRVEVKAIEQAEKDPDYLECRDAVFETCAAINRMGRMGTPIDLPWLFLKSAGQPNWLGVYGGKYNWALEAERGRATGGDEDWAIELQKKLDAES